MRGTAIKTGEGIEVGAAPVDEELAHVEGGGVFVLDKEVEDVHTKVTYSSVKEGLEILLGSNLP